MIYTFLLLFKLYLIFITKLRDQSLCQLAGMFYTALPMYSVFELIENVDRVFYNLNEKPKLD